MKDRIENVTDDLAYEVCGWYDQSLKTSVDEARKLIFDLKTENDHLRDLNNRALKVVIDAVMHGMPVTEEIAYLRNKILEEQDG